MFNPAYINKLSEVLKEKQKLVIYYNKLTAVIKNKTDKEKIKEINLEEQKHISIIKSLLLKASGEDRTENEKALSKKQGFPSKLPETIIYAEINLIKMIKEILISVQDIRIKNGLYYILTDDQRHVDTIIFLYSKHI